MGFWASWNRGLSYLVHGEDTTYEGQQRAGILKQMDEYEKDKKRRSIENGGQGLNNYELHRLRDHLNRENR